MSNMLIEKDVQAFQHSLLNPGDEVTVLLSRKTSSGLSSMSPSSIRLKDAPKIVLGDANVLYSRVLRDYLLHTAATGIR